MDFNVEKIAKLAKIKITADEKVTLENSIKDIIKMLEKLDKVEVKSEDLEEVLLKNLPSMEYREDEIDSSMSNDDLLKNAPKSMAGCIVVPKVVE